MAIGWVWGRWDSAVSAQVLLDAKGVLDLELTNVWQPLRRAEPGLSCARKLAAKQKGAVEVEPVFVTQKVDSKAIFGSGEGQAWLSPLAPC